MTRGALRFLISSLVLLVAAGCGPVTIGDGKMVTKTRELPLFTGVSVGGPVGLTVTEGDLSVLTVTSEDNILPLLNIEVRGNLLVIEPKEGHGLSPTQPIKATISVPRLERLEASGSSKIVTGPLVSGTGVALEVSGSSSVTTGAVSAPSMTIQASGSSTVRCEGWAATVSLEASGASKVTASALAAEDLTVDVSGGSAVTARASKAAHGKASGASAVVIEGSPEVKDVNTSGSSSLRFP